MRFRHRVIRRLRIALIGLAVIAAMAPTGAVAQPADPVTAKWQAYNDQIAKLSPAELAAKWGTDSSKVVGDTPADYPGMPGTPARNDVADAAPTRVHAPQAGGFDWPSAAIGAAGAGLLIVLSLGGVSVLSHRRTRLAR